MTLKGIWVAVTLVGGALLSGCAKDSDVRRYVRDDLQPYLDSLGYQLCAVKFKATPDASGRYCEGDGEGYTKPPPDGNP